MWRHSQENSIKSDVWVCLKIGISPSHGNFHRENDERDQGRWVLSPWEGADQQQLRLDFAYNFTGFGCGTLAFLGINQWQPMWPSKKSHHGSSTPRLFLSAVHLRTCRRCAHTTSRSPRAESELRRWTELESVTL